MSWSIGLISNEPKISKECAKELFEAQVYKTDDPDDKEQHGDIWWDLDDVTYKGKLTFNSDHNEWMDFLSNDEEFNLLKILKKHKIKGDITFGSLEGDNRGSFWGYRFDGNGGCVELTGEVVFKPSKDL